jgi:hypothetical protein
VVTKAWHSNHRTAPSNTTSLHPATIPSLIPIYKPGSEVLNHGRTLMMEAELVDLKQLTHLSASEDIADYWTV